MARLGQLLRSATSSVEPYCPDVGDFVRLQFDPQAGREQAGRRPALVLSPRKYNSLVRLCILCPMTNQAKGYPYEVLVDSALPMGGGVILVDQIKSLSWTERKCEFTGSVAPPELLADVMAKLRTLLPS
ncbi:type II toxin-antitoxin system PemK/MazF family toxin [Bradyrhizobium sp. 61]|uniref:type II toxin-antitoxin system PemK/MazF family toxin n=1 Tax=Bradyrhizobium sp. 61 TaxID=2782679 RepID=UPI001FF8F0ED|nr:type II toxin-antitoxin system PemK/MazF family toxin [Bradyrhizobium sp. 61]MCK1274784.1 type II toxin-antitoxin system PemK/MazF family toxin [Bradyrhizobium sp. 61]